MPSVKDNSTIEEIARVFCSNGRCKGKALSEVGYADSYALEGGRGCEVVFSNVHVKAAIARIDAETAQEQGWSIEKAKSMLLSVYERAKATNQPSAQVSSVIAINRMYGMDKDAGTGSTDNLTITVNSDKPGPKLAKDTA